MNATHSSGKNMAANDDVLDGFPSVVDYCEARIKKFDPKTLNACGTYVSIYRSFNRWVDDNRAHFPMVEESQIDVDQRHTALTIRTTGTDGTVFITQSNVELYFTTHLVRVNTSTLPVLRRIVSALTWFLQRVEDRGAPALQFSDRINRAMSDQQIVHASYRTEAYSGSDPHNGLKDLFSPEQTLELVNAIWEKRCDSLDLMFAYTWWRNAGVRGASTRKVVLSDLNLSVGFGPETKAPRNRTLLLVMRKGSMHKDRHTTDQQVHQNDEYVGFGRKYFLILVFFLWVEPMTGTHLLY